MKANEHEIITNDDNTSASSLFSEPNTTIDIAKTSFNKIPDKVFQKIEYQVKPFIF
jgi:hypothetical protein